MYIRTNVAALNLLRNYQQNYGLMTKAMERLSTGYRINRAADDAAGLAISERMKFQLNGLQQASRNIQDGISLIQTAEGAMSEIQAMLQRMNTLANQAANGTYSSKDREKLQLEFSQLRDEIVSIVSKTEFNRIKLLNGNLSFAQSNGLILQVGEQANDSIAFDMPDALKSISGLSSLNILTAEDASEAITALEAAVDNISYDRAKLGAYQNRLEHRYNYVMNYLENLSAAHSRIRDANMAEEMMNFVKHSMLTQVSTSLLAQANAMSKNILKLLEASRL